MVAGGLGAFTGLMYANTKTPWGKKAKKKRDTRYAKKYVKGMSKGDYAAFKYNQQAAKHNLAWATKIKNKKVAKSSKFFLGDKSTAIIKEYESSKKIKARTGKLTSDVMADYISKNSKGRPMAYQTPERYKKRHKN